MPQLILYPLLLLIPIGGGILWRKRRNSKTLNENVVVVETVESTENNQTDIDALDADKPDESDKPTDILLHEQPQASLKTSRQKSGWFHRGPSRREQFYQWVLDNDKIRDSVSEWITGLSRRETKLLMALLADYCQSFDMDFLWIFDPRLDKLPELKHALTQAITFYCEMLYHSIQINPQIHLFKEYIHLDNKPAHKSNQKLISNLYSFLLSRELVSSAPSNVLMGNEKQLKKYMFQTIQSLFDENPQAAMSALQQVLAGNVDGELDSKVGSEVDSEVDSDLDSRNS